MWTIFLALALGMDALSASIAAGAQPVSVKAKWIISTLVGLLHTVLPAAGMVIGSSLLDAMNWFGMVLLVFIGLQMIFAGFKSKKEQPMVLTPFKWLAFSIAVSLDSLSIGITLGITDLSDSQALIIFGIAAFLMTRIGFALGGLVTLTAGRFSEVIGGSILIGLALRMIE
ncbi:manganese efflux pump MntP [Jeotgalibacillus haloalkalitolerans]|uniref:Manganese efflux pump n=1 Tax=Jeotgalibacillus haloalkalitolerans TaxID=3104292 RepID=A0ABU5KJ31_9BACL|nr:manganese efflux pump [Jeotgalibacillus sp. HH7-29]MDZ5711228.1 manganese efflux pump [Jeotgalibacillus sp. HH7-29]